MKKIILLLGILLISFSVNSQIKVYGINMNGASEDPSNSSPGIGAVLVTIDMTLLTLKLQCNFSSLSGIVTAAHIHSTTINPNAGLAGVAVNIPGFPFGATSGTYDNTLNMALSTSYSASFITNNGGTVASAFNALVNSLDSNKAYVNIHTSTFGGGEIRGFPTFLNSNSFDLQSKLDIYPNPFSEVLKINNKTNKNLRVELFDLVGKMIESNSVNLDTSQFDYSYLKSGIYFIKVSTYDNQTATYKIIKT